MPVNFIGAVLKDGTAAVPYYEQLKTYAPLMALIALIKWWRSGPTNTWERDMHGRVVMITGGTSGLGAEVARNLAVRGAQVILLVRSTTDKWTVDYVHQLREDTQNAMIYAEEVDLEDLLSVRKFATKWLDNSPPRRLDTVICCAGLALPVGAERQLSKDGLELHLQTNYLGHFHLCNLLQPSFKVQPPDRDVRVIFTSCVAALMADYDVDDLEFLTRRRYPSRAPWKIFGAAKLELSMFAYELQEQLNSFVRNDKAPMNTTVCIVNPGMMRSPSFRRFASFGSVWGLVFYLILWPFWWLVLLSSRAGAENILYAVMSADVGENTECKYIQNCAIRKRPPRNELSSREAQQKLYKKTEELINKAERESAIRKNKEKEKEKKSGSSKVEELNGDESKPSASSTKKENTKASRRKTKKT